MKIPLRYQITGFDCGTTSVENAISYLYERDELPAVFIKTISGYTLDCYDDKGNLGQGGTSVAAMNFLTQWFNEYSKKQLFDLKCSHFTNEEVTMEIIQNCLANKGCVVLRTYLDVDHYVLITGIDKNFVYLFDPYYLEDDYCEENVEVVTDKPYNYNRKIGISRFDSLEKHNYSLGPIEKRECLIMNRNNMN